jgi:hypothetical protein
MSIVAEILEKIKQDAGEKITDPIERLESNSNKALKYSELLFRAKRSRNKQKTQVDKKYSELYKDAKYKSHLLLKNKADVDAHIDSNEEYLTIKSQLNEWDNLVQLLENLVSIYQQREASERLVFKAKTGIG